MGLIRITKNNGTPEQPGEKELVNGTQITRTTVSGGLVEIQLGVIDTLVDTIQIAYNPTAGTIDDAELYEAWEPVLVAAQGSVVTIIDAPIVTDSTDARIYPDVTPS